MGLWGEDVSGLRREPIAALGDVDLLADDPVNSAIYAAVFCLGSFDSAGHRGDFETQLGQIARFSVSVNRMLNEVPVAEDAKAMAVVEQFLSMCFEIGDFRYLKGWG